MLENIWNPWHGCKKYSEGCENCYMYYLDSKRDRDGSKIYKVKTNFNLLLKKTRDGNYKIKSGSLVHVCMTSDFFLEEADVWRKEAWKMIKERSDLTFWLQTKRAERVEKCLPKDWKDGYEYEGNRPLNGDWVKQIYDECLKSNVSLDFVGTANNFVKEGKTYHICKAYQHVMALKSGLQIPNVDTNIQIQIKCRTCKRRNSCNGCKNCGRCA